MPCTCGYRSVHQPWCDAYIPEIPDVPPLPIPRPRPRPAARQAVEVDGFVYHHMVVKYRLAPHGSGGRLDGGRVLGIFPEYLAAVEYANMKQRQHQTNVEVVVECY